MVALLPLTGFMTMPAKKYAERPHKKLEVWRRSFSLVKEIYRLTAALPESERYGLASQMRRAAVSVPCNIAEGAARSTDKEFVHFLYIASGSVSELDTLLLLCEDLQYLNPASATALQEQYAQVAAMLAGLIHKLRVKV